jgi:UDP-glucuronate 4-epimerase
MPILVTGSAGFIGFHLAKSLLDQDVEVVGIDSLNDYYSPALKEERLDQLRPRSNFRFEKIDICDSDALKVLMDEVSPNIVLHMAAQAGVRYSIENPDAYIRSNLIGHAAILECCRHADNFDHLIYASSSSVYGGNKKIPFSESDPVDRPVSLYAATKKADELLSYSYSHLYGIPQTGLRFFTVYGPWGRPDMAYWQFTDAILNDRPIDVFNNGDMKRDFTYIDDVVSGILRLIEVGPKLKPEVAPHSVYNIGNNQSEPLMKMIEVLEKAVGKTAQKNFKPMQQGDVKETYADISMSQRDFGYAPNTRIDEGLPKFVHWFREYYGK